MRPGEPPTAPRRARPGLARLSAGLPLPARPPPGLPPPAGAGSTGGGGRLLPGSTELREADPTQRGEGWARGCLRARCNPKEEGG